MGVALSAGELLVVETHPFPAGAWTGQKRPQLT
jgi:hypothetical protein